MRSCPPSCALPVHLNVHVAGSKWCSANDDMAKFGLTVSQGKLEGFSKGMPPCVIIDDVLGAYISHLLYVPQVRTTCSTADGLF